MPGFSHRFHRLEQISSGVCDRHGPGGVQAAVILELQLTVEAKEFRRAKRAIGACDGLRFIEQIWKRKREFAHYALHVRERIFWIVRWIISIDRNGADAERGKLFAIPYQTLAYGFDIRTMIADEHHQQSTCAAYIGRGVSPAIRGRQVEIGGLPAEIADGRLRPHWSSPLPCASRRARRR